jgi:hypothetical protein
MKVNLQNFVQRVSLTNNLTAGVTGAGADGGTPSGRKMAEDLKNAREAGRMNDPKIEDYIRPLTFLPLLIAGIKIAVRRCLYDQR